MSKQPGRKEREDREMPLPLRVSVGVLAALIILKPLSAFGGLLYKYRRCVVVLSF